MKKVGSEYAVETRDLRVESGSVSVSVKLEFAFSSRVRT